MRRSGSSGTLRGVVAREHTRRRALLVAIAALTLLGISPVIGHHLGRGAEVLLRGTDRVGELCLVALHIVLAPVHEFFHVVLVAGLAYAAWDRVRAWRRVRRVLGPLDAAPPRPGDPFWSAARAAGIEPRIVRVVEGLPNPAFTIGWHRPRIYVARALADRLEPSELAAVLAHEGAHVARRDPLRLSVLRFFACTLFWLPALRRLADDVADEAEVQADDVAAGSQPPLVLASAILSIAEWTQRPPHMVGTVGFACPDILERRVRRLAGEAPAAGTHVTWRSVLGAAAVLAVVWTSGAIMAHPLPGEPAHAMRSPARAPNCTRHRGPAILHIFCPGLSIGSIHYHCPRMDV
jgi:Zn-dependent protease with chaperone function